MAVGTFMGETFTASDKKIYTPQNMTGTAGGEYATHARANKKARSQFLGAKLRTYSVPITLDAWNGVNPRKKRDKFIEKAEKGKADYLVIGGKPVCPNRLVILDVSETWEEVMLDGVLVQCNITLQLQEYL